MIHTAVFWYDFKNWTFSDNATRRIYFVFWKLLNFSLNIVSKNRSFIFWKWVNELDPFFLDCDSKNTFCQIWLEWKFFLANMTQRIELFLSMTQRFDFFFDKKESQNSTFFLRIWPKNWRKELNPLFLEYDAQNWILFSNLPRIEPFFFFKIRLKHLNTFGKYDSKNWTLYLWLDSKYWTLYFEYGSKNWTHFFGTQRNVFFKKKTQRIELF